MASYYDTPQRYAEYAPKYNLELYASALTQRNQEYAQGLEKVEQYQETVAGLPVGRQADREYLQSKVNQLNTEITSAAGADFSDPNLIKKFKGMASKIYSDANVQTAINSASHAKSQFTIMQDYQRDGKSHKDNEDLFNYQYQKWASGTAPGQAFNADYIPYVNVQDEAVKLFKEKHPNVVFKQAPDGTQMAYTMTNTTLEQIDPNQVKRELEGLIASNGAWRQQIGISSWAAYRNHTPEDMKNIISGSYKTRKEDAETRLSKEYARRNDYVGDAAKLGEIEQNIKAINLELDNITAYSDEANRRAATDPDGLKADIYKQNLTNTLASIIGYTNVKQETVENPYYNQHIKTIDTNIKYEKLKLDQQKEQREANAATATPTFIGQGVETEQTKNPYQSFSAEISTQDGQIEDNILKTAILMPDAQKYLVDHNVTDPTTGATTHGKRYAGANAAEQNASRNAVRLLYDNAKSRMESGEAVDPVVRRSISAMAPTINLNTKMKEKMVEAQSDADRHFKELAKTDPRYKIITQLDEIPVTAAAGVGPDGREVRSDKNDIIDAMYTLVSAGRTPGANYLSSIGTGRSSYQQAFVAAKQNINEDPNLTEEQKRSKRAAVDYIKQNLLDPFGGDNILNIPTGRMTPEQKNLARIQKLALDEPGFIARDFRTGAMERYKEDRNNHLATYMKKYQDVLSYNAKTVLNIGDKTQGEQKTYLNNLLTTKERAFMKETPTGFRQSDIVYAKAILADPKQKDVSVTYHQPPGAEPYYQITGFVGDEMQTGKIPLTMDEAQRTPHYATNPAQTLDKMLTINTQYQEGTNVIQAADNMPVDNGDFGAYYVNYGVVNNNGQYYVTLRGSNKETREPFAISIDPAQPFSNTQQIMAWLQSTLVGNKAVAQQMIAAAINNKQALPRYTPAGAGGATPYVNPNY